MANKQKLKELLEKLKKWKDDRGVDDEEFDGLLNEFEASFQPSGDEEDGSNPPHGPGTPP